MGFSGLGFTGFGRPEELEELLELPPEDPDEELVVIVLPSLVTAVPAV